MNNTFAEPLRRAARLAAASCLLLSGGADAAMFDSGLPAGWECAGHCGTLAADGVVSLAPGGGSRYAYVSSVDSTRSDIFLPGVDDVAHSRTGSSLTSQAFSAIAGAQLKLQFNYVTSDGGGFSDYAWARLLDTGGQQVALLYTARTRQPGDVVPGFNMPAPDATLTPATIGIQGGNPAWSALGDASGQCYEAGCGHTGWVASQYTIASAGTYRLEYGVVNWGDNIYDSGLAFDGEASGIMPLPVPVPVPEPAGWGMLLAGLGLVGAIARRKRCA
ncbi:MAG: NF038132 family protein [Pseudomonadota bacterium]